VLSFLLFFSFAFLPDHYEGRKRGLYEGREYYKKEGRGYMKGQRAI
jgi:hypothetical protein